MQAVESVHKVALNFRHERFCQLIAKGVSTVEAYKATYGPEKSKNVARSAGGRLLSQVAIKSRIAEILRPATDKIAWSVAERLKFAREVCETPIAEISPRHKLAQSIKIGKDGEREIKMPDKLRALDIYNELAGDYGRAGSSDNPFAFVLAIVQTSPVQGGDKAADVIEIKNEL